MSYPRVLAVGDRAVTIELGATLDEETVGRVRALDQRLREHPLSGVLETVPTYAALMVLYDRHRLSFAGLSEHLLRLAHGVEARTGVGQRVEIQAAYDGEDLPEVADACGLTRDAVVELHSGRDYSVLMLGFSPGFAYMGFVDERLQRPRRKTPRTRVPAGAIAVAGPQTGIYPRTLPGGWNLLGRTSAELFDPEAPAPALLMPGDRVRFVPTTVLDPRRPQAKADYVGDGVHVIEAGILSTIQDAGRPGLRRLAVPLTGYADVMAAQRANRCVGSPVDAPLVEVCGPGFRMRFEKTTFVAITGARTAARLERGDLDGGSMPMPMDAAVRVRESNVLVISTIEDGVRAYVAIAGLEAPRLLGSASADLGSGFLRVLRAGDRLGVGAFDSDRVARDPERAPEPKDEVRVILGPQADHFNPATVEVFLSALWRVGFDSDRVGARLDGPPLVHAGPSEIVSDGMVPGCIQVPPDGRPIVMLSDCPTTGGYPKIGCVIGADLGRVAQAVPGRSAIRFVALRIEDLEV
jgi:KipI family sensor histidine kinase inhibitor